MKEKLIERISDDLYIARDSAESKESWKLRILYSAVGRMALAALWDKQEEDISVAYLKKKIQDNIILYKKIFPELQDHWYENPNKILYEEIYEIYNVAGNWYHAPHHLHPSIRKEVTYKGIKFVRGCSPTEKVYMSGLGIYDMNEDEGGPSESDDFREMFQMDAISLREGIDKYLLEPKWEKVTIDNLKNVEYLNAEYSSGKKYWRSILGKTRNISILRMGNKGKEVYYLYQYQGGGSLMISNLPKWMMEEKNYLDFANRILFKNGSLPPIKFQKKDTIVNIFLGYLLPPPEMNFFKLYSWPHELNNNWEFKRVMSSEIFAVFQEVLEEKGYCFKEV